MLLGKRQSQTLYLDIVSKKHDVEKYSNRVDYTESSNDRKTFIT